MSRKKILLVDDSPTAIQWQRMILENDPYDILIASNGEEGVRVARAAQPDLVLLDVMMPVMDGLAVLRELRSDVRFSRTPVLMVTTRSEMPSVLEAYQGGCNEYITKPVDRRELLTKVRGYLVDPETPHEHAA